MSVSDKTGSGASGGTNLSTLLITGLLALLGTITGGIIKSHQDNTAAESKFQTDLVMKALESPNQDERLTSLQFLVDTHLISDADIASGVRQYLDSKPTTVPQFKPPATSLSPGQILVPSTPETSAFTDFQVFICDPEWSNPAAQDLAAAVTSSVKASGGVGQVRVDRWSAYGEISLDQLRDRITLIVDKGRGEERELPRLLRTLQTAALPGVQVLDNRGRATPWLISVVVCPNRPE